MKKRIRLTESDLHNIIKESVEKVLREEEENWGYDLPYNEEFDNMIQRILTDINNGKFDDSVFKSEWVRDMRRKYGVGIYDDMLMDLIKNRKRMLSADYALENNNDNLSNFHANQYRKHWKPDVKYPEKQWDKSIYNGEENKRERKLHKLDLWHNYSDGAPIFNRKGVRDFDRKRIEDMYNGRNPEEEKLHTKDSLNRTLINPSDIKKREEEIDKKKERARQRIDKIGRYPKAILGIQEYLRKKYPSWEWEKIKQKADEIWNNDNLIY